MKKNILFILIFSLIFLNLFCFVLADTGMEPLINAGLGDMAFTSNKLAVLSGSNSFENNLVSCGCDTYSGGCTPRGYNPSSVYAATQYNCGSGYALSKNFGSIVTTPGALWNCQYNYICNMDLTLKDKLQVIHSVGVAGSYPSCSQLGTNWVSLSSAITGRFNDGYMATNTVLCVKQIYWKYFSGEIVLVSSNKGGYGVDVSCPSSSYTKLNQISTATYGPPPAGQMVTTAICIKNNGVAATINLDYNEQKCRDIYGITAWGPDYSGWGGSQDKRCCGDDNEINSEVLGISSYICKKNPTTGAFYWGKMPFEIVSVGVSNGPYNRNKEYILTEIVANEDIAGTVYAGASLITNFNSIDCPKAGCIWEEYSGCYCNLPYQTFSLGSGIQETKTINFKIHRGFLDGVKGITMRLWKIKSDTCNLMPNSPYYEDGCLSNAIEGSIASYSNSSFITVTPEACTNYSNWIIKTADNGNIIKTRDSDNDGIYDQYCSSEGGVEPIILS